MFDDHGSDVVLLRLINNDRIIGQVVKLDQDIVALYAPMLVDLEADIHTLSIYDPLSDTTMAILDNSSVLTITIPKVKLKDEYELTRKSFYPDLEELRKKMLADLKKNYGDAVNQGKMDEMFSDLMNNSLPIDKSKLN
jgi:hypothetical protein